MRTFKSISIALIVLAVIQFLAAGGMYMNGVSPSTLRWNGLIIFLDLILSGLAHCAYIGKRCSIATSNIHKSYVDRTWSSTVMEALDKAKIGHIECYSDQSKQWDLYVDVKNVDKAKVVLKNIKKDF